MSDPVQPEVRIGDGDVVLTLSGPPFAGHLGAGLKGPFIDVGDSIPLDASLPGFFAELDRSWRGWDGWRSWESAGGGLTLRARHDGIGRVLIEAVFRSPEYRDDSGRAGAWQASAVVTVEVSRLSRIAIDLRELRASEPVE